jgi:hypothetical protein
MGFTQGNDEENTESAEQVARDIRVPGGYHPNHQAAGESHPSTSHLLIRKDDSHLRQLLLMILLGTPGASLQLSPGPIDYTPKEPWVEIPNSYRSVLSNCPDHLIHPQASWRPLVVSLGCLDGLIPNLNPTQVDLVLSVEWLGKQHSVDMF